MGNCCCGPNQEEACGWPKGTIRGTLALILGIMAFLMAGATIGLLIWYQQYTGAVTVLGLVFTIISGVISFYFGAKAGDTVSAMANTMTTNMQNTMKATIAERDARIERMERGLLIRNDRLHNNGLEPVLEPVEVIGA